MFGCQPKSEDREIEIIKYCWTYRPDKGFVKPDMVVFIYAPVKPNRECQVIYHYSGSQDISYYLKMNNTLYDRLIRKLNTIKCDTNLAPDYPFSTDLPDIGERGGVKFITHSQNRTLTIAFSKEPTDIFNNVLYALYPTKINSGKSELKKLIGKDSIDLITRRNDLKRYLFNHLEFIEPPPFGEAKKVQF